MFVSVPFFIIQTCQKFVSVNFIKLNIFTTLYTVSWILKSESVVKMLDIRRATCDAGMDFTQTTTPLIKPRKAPEFSALLERYFSFAHCQQIVDCVYSIKCYSLCVWSLALLSCLTWTIRSVPVGCDLKLLFYFSFNSEPGVAWVEFNPSGKTPEGLRGLENVTVELGVIRKWVKC